MQGNVQVYNVRIPVQPAVANCGPGEASRGQPAIDVKWRESARDVELASDAGPAGHVAGQLR